MNETGELVKQQDTIRELPAEFIGKGEVRGYVFTQIAKSDKGYIYSVRLGADAPIHHYEVFERKINSRFGGISYPGSPSFGISAWIASTLEKAQQRLSIIEQGKI